MDVLDLQHELSLKEASGLLDVPGVWPVRRSDGEAPAQLRLDQTRHRTLTRFIPTSQALELKAALNPALLASAEADSVQRQIGTAVVPIARLGIVDEVNGSGGVDVNAGQ